MSTHQEPQLNPKQKHLNIEFAGICCLVKGKQEDGSSRSAVLLPNVPLSLAFLQGRDPSRNWLAESTPHTASLVVPSNAVIGDCGDYSISVPGADTEYAVWNLDGHPKVKLLGADQGSVNFETDPAPSVRAAGASELVRLNEVAESSSIAPGAKELLTTWVNLPGGSVTAIKSPDDGTRIRFPKETKETGTYRTYAWRFAVSVPFTDQISLDLTGGSSRRVTFARSTSVLIGNLCHDTRKPKKHFLAYYALLSDGLRPDIEVETEALPQNGQKVPGSIWEFPPYCFVSVLEPLNWPGWLR